MELALQYCLRRNMRLEELNKVYGIKTRRHNDYPNLVCFKYDQIRSPMSEQICQEARGIILDENKNWEVVSFPYTKFFNYGEGHAAKINLRTAKIYPKLDGSLMTLYYYNGDWLVQSSGTPDASGQVNDAPDMTFAELFWQVWENSEYKLPHKFSDFCFMFELETPLNQVVVRQSDYKLTLHGVRNVKTLREEQPEHWGYYWGWDYVKPLGASSMGLMTWDFLKKRANSLDPFSQEGYILVEPDKKTGEFHRVKMKGDPYVALHHQISSHRESPKNMWQVIRHNETSEWITHFPNMVQSYCEKKSIYVRMLEELTKVWTETSSIESQIDFARQIKEYPFSGLLFMLRSGKIKSIAELPEHLTNVTIQSFIKLMESYEAYILTNDGFDAPKIDTLL